MTDKIKKKYFQLRQEASLNTMLGNPNYKVTETLDKALIKLEKKFPKLDEAYSLARGF